MARKRKNKNRKTKKRQPKLQKTGSVVPLSTPTPMQALPEPPRYRAMYCDPSSEVDQAAALSAVLGTLGQLGAKVSFETAGLDLKRLALSQAMRHLSCEQNHVPPALALCLEPVLGRLHVLSLSHGEWCNNIGDEGSKALARVLPWLSGLKALDLDGNFRCDCDEGAVVLFSSLLALTRLQDLYLDNNGIGDQGANALGPSLAAMTHLEVLSLKHNEIDCQGAKALGRCFKTMSRLRELYLSSSCSDDCAANALISRLGSVTTLQVLHMSHLKVGYGSLKPMRMLAKLKNLEDLELHENFIGADGARVLSESLLSMTALRSLDLAYENDLDRSAVVALISSIEMLPGPCFHDLTSLLEDLEVKAEQQRCESEYDAWLRYGSNSDHDYCDSDNGFGEW